MLKLPALAPPHRLDFTPRALVDAVGALLTRREAHARERLEAEWGGPAFLSVRSGLCALLASSGWERGSEVLVSALTIGDIPKLIEAHGFVPVAVDVDPATLEPSLPDLVRKTSTRTKAVIVAHLFGARIAPHALKAIARFAHVHGMVVLEDCAQAYVGPSWRGDDEADVSMFSFGTLKTGTALGGALFTVRDPELRARLAAVERAWPRQPTRAFAEKIAKAAFFLVAQNARVYGLIAALLALMGSSINVALRKATRGFPAADVDELLVKLRKRPCAAQLAFLRSRLLSFDDERLSARARAGEARLARSRAEVAGGAASSRTHWLFAVRTKEPARLRERLAQAHIDASGASNVTAVGRPLDAPRAHALVNEIVFVPVYPELDARTARALRETLSVAFPRPHRSADLVSDVDVTLAAAE